MCPQMIPGPLVYDDGLSSNGARTWFKNYPMDAAHNPDYLVMFEDFGARKAADLTNDFDSVKDAGATAISIDANGHGKLLSTATTVNDGALVQTANQPVKLQTNKKMWFEARVQGSSVADMEMFVGLAKKVTTNPEDLLVANFARIGFELRGSSAVVKASMGTGAADSTASLGVTLADNTFVKLGFYFDGQNLFFFVDRVLKLSMSKTGVGPVLDTDALGIAFEERSISAAGTRSALIDYWMVIQER